MYERRGKIKIPRFFIYMRAEPNFLNTDFMTQYDLRRYISENQAKLEAAGYIIEFADMAGPLEEFGTFEDHNRSEDGEYRRLLDDMADAIGTTYRDLHLALRRLFYRDARYHDKILQLRPYDFYAFRRHQSPVVVGEIKGGGITFQYTEKGNVGLCRADKLLFISTAGGPLINGNLGAVYLKDLCGMLGIDQFDAICADGLDIAGVEVDGILDSKNAEITEKAAAF